MTNRNYYWIAAGLINLFTAFLHTIGGQLDLINPMLSSQLSGQIKTELAGAWHIVTIVLLPLATPWSTSKGRSQSRPAAFDRFAVHPFFGCLHRRQFIARNTGSTMDHPTTNRYPLPAGHQATKAQYKQPCSFLKATINTLKNARYVEAKVNIAIEEITCGFTNKSFFDHSTRIGQMQLKNMSTRFNIYTNG